MKKNIIFLVLGIALMPVLASAQSVNPKAYYTDIDGISQESDNIEDGQAPLTVTFRANPSNMDDYFPSYEWHFRKTGSSETDRDLFVRYEEDTEYTFTESGTYHVVLKTKLDQDGTELDSMTVNVTISQSFLEFPNAFSPNNDGTNDLYCAMGANDPSHPKRYKSIVEFRAIIFNRWGQKLYEWNDLDGGWDGKYNGHDVKDGVYFVQVIAKGADGKKYHIRKDVNLLRGYNSEGGNSGGKE